MVVVMFGCGDSTAEESEDTTGSEVVEPEPTPAHEQTGTEAHAVEVALHIAEQEGYDVMSYEEITVHRNDDEHWVVQLRRPRIHRFLEVTVNPQSGAGSLRVRSTGHH